MDSEFVTSHTIIQRERLWSKVELECFPAQRPNEKREAKVHWGLNLPSKVYKEEICSLVLVYASSLATEVEMQSLKGKDGSRSDMFSKHNTVW